MNPLTGSVSSGDAKSTRQVVVSWSAGIPLPMVTPSKRERHEHATAVCQPERHGCSGPVR